MKKIINKIAIGSVQFGLDYGISNTTGKTNNYEVKNILEIAKSNNINFVDTASSYGNAEKILGKNDLKNLNVVSKFIISDSNSLEKQLNTSLKNLKIDSLYAYLAHRPEQIFNSKKNWENLKSLKKQGLVKKIGYSLNNTLEIEQFLNKKYIPDLVQIPYNLLDKRFEEYFEILKNLGVEIHTRSTFLQGLFFLNQNDFPKKLSVFKSYINKLNNICDANNIEMNMLAICFPLNNIYIDKVVIGVNSSLQLKSNLESVKEIQKNLIDDINKISFKDKELLSPSNW